jgi:hypothetical protein
VEDDERGVLSLLDSLETPALRNLRINTSLHDGTSADRILSTHLVSSHLNTSSVSLKSCDILQRGGSLVFLASSLILMDPRRWYSQVDPEGASFEFQFYSLHANFVGDAEGNTNGESAWPGAAAVRDMSRLSSLIVRAGKCTPCLADHVRETQAGASADLAPVCDSHTGRGHAYDQSSLFLVGSALHLFPRPVFASSHWQVPVWSYPRIGLRKLTTSSS